MKPTGDVREELIDELLDVERRIEKADEKKKAAVKAYRDVTSPLFDRKGELLDLLEGKEHLQPSLPLTPGKTDRRGAGLSIALADNGVPVPKAEVEEAKRELDRKRRARDAEVDVTPAKGRALPVKGSTLDELAGGRAEAIARKPIAWSTEPDGRVLGIASDGVMYAVKQRKGGCTWHQGRKNGGPFKDEATAKAHAEAAERDRLGLPEPKPSRAEA